MLTLTSVNLWVRDQEEALAFYTGKLGFEKVADITLPELGGFRWLTVAPPGSSVTVVLMAVPGPPVFDDATSGALRELMSKGAIGGLFYETDDIRATHDELVRQGVDVTDEPAQRPYGIDAGYRDPSGNGIRVLERPADANR